MVSRGLQRLAKLQVSLRRRKEFVANIVRRRKRGTPFQTSAPPLRPLQAGDTVRVRSIEEIRSTLNNWNTLSGCAFLREMEPYCGTVQRVHKCVRRFLNESDYLVKRSKGLVILQNVFCEGTRDFGPCDRSCFFFWREEWLELVEDDVV
jgi:hypothetical protein